MSKVAHTSPIEDDQATDDPISLKENEQLDVEVDEGELVASVQSLILVQSVASDDESEDEENAETDEDEDEAIELTLDHLIARRMIGQEEWVETTKEKNGFSADAMTVYLKDVCKISLLTAAEEISLARRIADGDKAARDILLSANLRLSIHIAKKYLASGIPLSDLVSEGNLGLMEAVSKFDPTRGFRFSTYATWWVRQSIQRAVYNQGRLIRVPVHMAQMQRTLHKIETAAKVRDETLTDEQIAVLMDIPVERVQQVREVVLDAVSLSMPTSEDGGDLYDILGDEDQHNPYHTIRTENANVWLKEALARLSTKEKNVIHKRFGLAGNEEMTLDEVGAIQGLTRERIRQIEVMALRKLRHFFSIRGIEIPTLLSEQ